jgi:two-component system NtrC family sensor kinase
VPIRIGRFSLRAVLFAGAVLVPAGLFALGAWQSRTSLEDQAEQEVRSQLQMLQENAGELFQTYRLVLDQADLRVTGLSWEEIRSSQPLWDDLRKLTERLPQVDAVFMIDPGGVSATTTRAFPSPPVDFSDRDYFSAQRNADAGFFLGRSYIGRISHHRIVNFSIRRTGSPGAFDGVIGLSAYDYIDRFYTNLTNPGPGTLIALVRDDGELLAGNDVAHGTGVPSALTRLAAERDSTVQRVAGGKHGEHLLVGQIRLRDFPAHVVYGINDAVIHDAWITALQRWALLAFGTALMLLLLAWQLARYIAAESLAQDRVRKMQTDLLLEAQRRQTMEMIGAGFPVLVGAAYALEIGD